MVLDGLDECENVEVDMIASAINKLRTSRATGFQLLCLGRPYLERRLFNTKNQSHQMTLSCKNVELDIQKYIEFTLDECLEETKLKLDDPR